jgi:translation initiation factor 2B subunit (eIF-2B alpha/beta/delta family)
VVELFLKTVGLKRRFQVSFNFFALRFAFPTLNHLFSFLQLIIAEGGPSLDGHKLAYSLCKVPNISVTIIPDSNIYAIMARVNKVSFLVLRF